MPLLDVSLPHQAPSRFVYLSPLHGRTHLKTVASSRCSSTAGSPRRLPHSDLPTLDNTRYHSSSCFDTVGVCGSNPHAPMFSFGLLASRSAEFVILRQLLKSSGRLYDGRRHQGDPMPEALA